MVRGALEVRAQLRALVADSKTLGPDEFKARYEQFLTDHQAHL